MPQIPNLSRRAVLAGILAFALIAVVILAAIIGRASAPATPKVLIAPPTATALVPTATPALTVKTPQIVGAWMSPSSAIPCPQCYEFTFISSGPFDVVMTCNPYGVFADSLPALEFQLFNSGGHLLDTVSHTCGDPSKYIVTTAITPELLPAGSYTMRFSPNTTAPMTILILAAS